MPELLGWAAGLLAVAGVFGLLFYLMRRSQAGDQSKCGQDSSAPGGYGGDTDPGP